MKNEGLQVVLLSDRGALREKDAALFLGLSVASLRKKRLQTGQIPFFKDGSSVLYAVKDLKRWVDSQPRH